MPKKHLSENDSQQTNIALWGPTGAGKDWLIHSFVKELEYYYNKPPEELKKEAAFHFHFDVSEFEPGNPKPVPSNSAPPINIPATPYAIDKHYLFRRVAMQKGEAYLNSAQGHDIVIHNDAGANLVKSISDPTTFEATFQTLISARNLLLVLSIPKELGSGSALQVSPSLPEPDNRNAMTTQQKADTNGEQVSKESKSDWTREEYNQFMKGLLNSLAQTPGCNLAVCMTKCDQLEFRTDPLPMFQRRYGKELWRLLEVHSQQHNIKVFITSAAGYILQNGSMIPNFSGGTLLKPELWNPINAAAPFFWIFEKIERKRLNSGLPIFRKGREINYIPYPDPRPF